MLTKIPDNKELIIFDFYGTIICTKYYNKNILRNGIREMVYHLNKEGKAMAIASDGEINTMRRDLGYACEIEFLDCFDKIYDWKNVIYKNGRLIKDLASICNEFMVPSSKAMLIGNDDLGLDRYSAEHFGLDYIIVPNSINDFSFLSLLP